LSTEVNANCLSRTDEPPDLEPAHLPSSIGVLEAADKSMPIGMASEIGWTDGGLAVWTLGIYGTAIQGRWVVVDRRFVAVHGDPA
jgi:hypothetical protein